MGYGYGYPMMYGWGFGFGWIIMLIFWVLVIWAIIAIVHAIAGKGSHWHGHEKEDQAMNALRERYAKGEINKEEFDQKQKDLMMK